MAENSDIASIKKDIVSFKQKFDTHWKVLVGYTKNWEAYVKEKASIDRDIETLKKDTEGNRQALVRARKYVDEHDTSADKDIASFKQKFDTHWKVLVGYTKNWEAYVKEKAAIDRDIETLKKDTEGNRQALVRARKYVDGHDTSADKKIESIKKMMDEMEKRHVKLIDTQIKNYDKLIRKVISQEVSKAGKGRR